MFPKIKMKNSIAKMFKCFNLIENIFYNTKMIINNFTWKLYTAIYYYIVPKNIQINENVISYN